MAQTLKENLDAQMQDMLTDLLLPKRDTVITTTKPRLRVDEYYPHVIEFKPKAVPGESLTDSFGRYAREMEQEHRWAKVFGKINENVAAAKKEIKEFIYPEPKKWFTLTYKEANTDNTYVSGVYANNSAEAQQIANTRNIGEQVSGGLFYATPKEKRDWELPSVSLKIWFDKYFNNKKYWTERQNGTKFFDIIKLDNDEQLEFRKLGEKACHGTVYLSFLALKSGVATIEECLSDGGIAHHVAHLVTGTVDDEVEGHGQTEYQHVMPMLEAIEQRIPGLNP